MVAIVFVAICSGGSRGGCDKDGCALTPQNIFMFLCSSQNDYWIHNSYFVVSHCAVQIMKV